MTTLKSCLLISVAALSAGAVSASEPASASQAVATRTADESQARRVVRDKDTGKLRAPTAAEAAEMAAAEPAQKSAPLVVRRYPSGMSSVVLGPEHLVTIQARRAPDGSLVQSHDKAAHEHGKTAEQNPTK